MSPLEDMRAKGQTDASVDRIEALLGNAKPVPLTDQVRLDLREAQRLLAELRDALAAERRARR
jgi:hypothetical protein